MAKSRRKQGGSLLPIQLSFQRPPSEREAQATVDARERISKRQARVELKLKQNAKGVGGISPTHSDNAVSIVQLTEAFGTTSQDFLESGINAMLNAVAPKNAAVSNETANAPLAVVDDARPKDEIEAMLASRWPSRMPLR